MAPGGGGRGRVAFEGGAEKQCLTWPYKGRVAFEGRVALKGRVALRAGPKNNVFHGNS